MSKQDSDDNNTILMKDSRMEDRTVVRLEDFPRSPELQKTYAIDVEVLKYKLWKLLLFPSFGCRQKDSSKMYWAILFWLGMALSVLALIISFIKDSQKHETLDAMLSYYTIAEMMFGMVAIIVSFSKHVVKWRSMRRSHRGIIEPNSSRQKRYWPKPCLKACGQMA